MARTSECGEGDGAGCSSSSRNNGQGLATSIKQETLANLDQSSDASLSQEEKDWPFLPTSSTSSNASGNELIQQTVLFGTNVTDMASKEKMEKFLDNSTSASSKKAVCNMLSEIEKLSDVERLLLYFRLPLGRSSDVDPLRMPLNPLGSRPEIMQTVVWIQTHLEEDVEISLPKHEVYEEYLNYCTENSIKPLSTADFGKVMKQVFPAVRPRRLGTRGHSRYCYSGLRKKEELDPPMLADLYCDVPGKSQTTSTVNSARLGSQFQQRSTDEPACALVREWAEKLLGIHFSGMAQLADYLVDKLYVDQRSRTVSQWTSLRSTTTSATPSNEGEVSVADSKGLEQDHMRELKRKLQEQHNMVARRQAQVPNRHNKKTKVSGSIPSSPPPPLPAPTEDVKETKSSIVTTNGGGKKNSRNKRKLKGDQVASSKSANGLSVGITGMESTGALEIETITANNKMAGKVPIPRLISINRSSPARLPSLAVMSGNQSQSPSPTAGTSGKPKFVPIQPKPSGLSESGQNGLTSMGCPSLPQLKEEDSNSRVATDLLEMPWGEGASHDEELVNYWSAGQQPGEPMTDSSSPKPAQLGHNEQLSQLRVLLEQNEAAKAKPLAATTLSGLLERRNVRFETTTGLEQQTTGVNANVNGVVPPSPNTRRRAFNFTPISPRLTPDVPPSPGSSSSTGQLRHLLSTSSGIASPFVSPRQTPIPGSCSSLPSSQPHSRHNSGHMMPMDTPTSIVTCESNSNDSAFVSPLNTPLSVNRSRHNSAANNGNGCNSNGCGSNMLVNRARHSSGASVAIRHAPYPTTAQNHLISMMNQSGQDGLINSLNAAVASAARSRHSSAGSSPSLPRSAPLSPLVQSHPQQESSLGCERIRQDLRRRHVSAGVVLGLSRHQATASGLGRSLHHHHLHQQHQSHQTTLNSAAPLWGQNDPLAQEIEGLLDSASSSLNDSVLGRSQSVPLHQMLQQMQYQAGQSQSYASLSQPSTPFGCNRQFSFNASAASSPYASYTPTPVPSEWADFNSHANSDSGAEGFAHLMDPATNMESLQEIISEVYANNQQELAPCLDGLGAEALQHQQQQDQSGSFVSSSDAATAFTHLSFQGSNSGIPNMDSDPSLSCSDTGDGFPLSDLNDSVVLPGLMGAEDLAATLVNLKEGQELNRLVQEAVDNGCSANGSILVPQGM